MKAICERCGKEFEVRDTYFENQPGNYEEIYYCKKCEAKERKILLQLLVKRCVE